MSAGGERTIAADELFVGPRRTSLVAGELIVGIEATLPGGPFATAQTRFQARAAAAGFMNCAACVALATPAPSPRPASPAAGSRSSRCA